MDKQSQAPRRRVRRRDRLIQDAKHDVYRERGKPRENTVCRDCGAEVRKGRWIEVAFPFGARRRLCPACKRTRDGYPAGELTLAGGFARRNLTELLNLARNVEELEKGEHPLSRIMDVRETADGAVITTTDDHLARRIGDAIHSAYAGDLSLDYALAERFVRLSWQREGG